MKSPAAPLHPYSSDEHYRESVSSCWWRCERTDMHVEVQVSHLLLDGFVANFCTYTHADLFFKQDFERILCLCLLEPELFSPLPDLLYGSCQGSNCSVRSVFELGVLVSGQESTIYRAYCSMLCMLKDQPLRDASEYTSTGVFMPLDSNPRIFAMLRGLQKAASISASSSASVVRRRRSRKSL